MNRTTSIADRLREVEDNIAAACERSGRPRSAVRLIVVTKTASIEQIRQVIRLGCTDLGENRVQHLKQVADEVDVFLRENAENPDVPDGVTWHMIGHLQRNKTRQALKITRVIHSLDTLRLAEEINTQAAKQGFKTDCMLQVNCSGEPQKYGVPVGAAIHLAEQVATMPNVRLIGLMTMAPLTLNKDVVRACFIRAREVFEEIRGEKIAGSKFKHLSMGMSQDYEIAVEEGATMLRVGSAIFA